MGLRSWLARQIAPKSQTGRRRRGVNAGYDAAQTGIDSDHWFMADSLNANAANSPEVRRTIRERARYEYTNNGYAQGLIDQLTKDMVGSCPRLQLTIPGADPKSVRQVERHFKAWCRLANIGEKLRILDTMAYRDGEGFAVFGSNPNFPDVQLDLKLFEADQVTTPYPNYLDLAEFDGGRLDEFGNVSEWSFLRTHPGSALWIASFLHFDMVPARNVVQWFAPRRAGQLRGVSEMASSLTLYAYLRRVTLATVTAAETAANIAGVLETDTAPDGSGTPSVEAMDQVPMPRGTMLTIPAGWKAKGFDATQPTTNYPAFKAEILTETGRPMGAPMNISTGSSAAYNYSSARADLGIYQGSMRVRRSSFASRVLDPLFRAWVREALLVPGLLAGGLPPLADWSWDWFFDAFPILDPIKEANADDVRLKNGTTSLSEIFAEYGQDWREQLEQRAAEVALMNELGLSSAMAASSGSTSAQFDDEGNKVPGVEDAGASGGGGVQSTALNGAQITSLLLIADGVVTKQYPADAAIAMVQGAFPLMPIGLIKRFIEPLAAYDAPPATPESGAVTNA